MSGYLPEPPFSHDQQARIGILLINLGTPEAPTAQAVRPYLKQFLSDTRVIEIPKAIWWLILNGIILNTRPKQSAEKYASIWRRMVRPVHLHPQTNQPAQGPAGRAGLRNVVDFAMRYGQPSVESAIMKMRAQGVDRLLVIPLYPQYAGSSSATALDDVFGC
jgi:ferrochelatase